MGWPHAGSSMFTGVFHETFTPDKTTIFTSSFFSNSPTTQSQKELLSIAKAITILVTENTSSSIASTISWVTSNISTSGKQGQPATFPNLSISPQETMVVSQTHWTQGTGTTGDTHLSSTRSSVTQPIVTVTSVSPASILSEHRSQQTITVGPTSQLTLVSTSTSQESSAISQIGHTQGTKTTQEF